MTGSQEGIGPCGIGTWSIRTWGIGHWRAGAAAFLLTALGGASPALGNEQSGKSTDGKAPAQETAGSILKLSGAWIQGQGFAVIFGDTYDACAARCLETPSCVMLEFYRPERRCSLHDAMRPRLTGGASYVGIRQSLAR